MERSDKGERTYNYNAAERLIRYSSTTASQSTPSIEANYRYDPLGQRISKEVKEGQTTKVTYFFYSDKGLLGEASEQGQMTRAYAFNPQKSEQGLWNTDPIWQADVSEAQLTSQSTSVHYLHTDHLGTPVLGTSKKGAVIWNGVADAFGATGALPQSQVEMNLRFPGQYFDTESGVNQNFNRNLSSDYGRYSQIDAIGIFGDINTYAYSGNNPLRYIDDNGEAKKDPALIEIGKKIKEVLSKICKKEDESCKEYYERLYKTCTGMLVGGGVACGPILSDVGTECILGNVPICPEIISCGGVESGGTS